MKTLPMRVSTLSGPALTWAFARVITGKTPDVIRVLNQPDISPALIMGAMSKYRVDLEWFTGQGHHSHDPVCAYIAKESDVHEHWWGSDIVQSVARCVVGEHWPDQVDRITPMHIRVPAELAGV